MKSDPPGADPDPGQAFVFQLSPDDQQLLLTVARQSIQHGVGLRCSLPVRAAEYPVALREPRAVFVTLCLHGRLRGCIGAMEAVNPLVEAVAQYAHASAYSDERFPPVRKSEINDLAISISVLGPMEPMLVSDEAELLTRVRPGVDGLFLQAGRHHATLLPSVWEDIPDPAEFIKRLKLKAGLRTNEWHPHWRMQRYSATTFGPESR